MKPSHLDHITQKTIGHYDARAQDFREGTWDHDVTQNYAALLEPLPKDRPLKILDLGCGPGRDLVYFKSLGHEAIGLEGSPEFCRMAREASGCEVWQQNFLKLDLPEAFFDGIFANASLFHVPRKELPRVLKEFHHALVPGGILFSSNPRGNDEGWNGERYGAYFEFEEYEKYLNQAGFTVVKHYYRPSGKPREEQPWLAVVAQRLNNL